MAQSIRVWVKKQLRLDMLTFRQREMYELGQSGLMSVADRLRQAKGPEDAAAKPLKVPYARFKSRKGKGNKRDLFFTGAMLSNLRVRTVTETSAKASLTSRKERIKGMANQKREPWLVFSPINKKELIEKTRAVLAEWKKRAVLSKNTGVDLG